MASPRPTPSTDTVDSLVEDAPVVEEEPSSVVAAVTPLDASYGQMTITLVPNSTALPIPVVTFGPVGHFTARLIEHYLPLIGQEIQRAQAKVRHEQNYGPAKDAA